MATDLDTILLIVFGTVAGIFGLLFLMAALEPPKLTAEAQPQTLKRNSTTSPSAMT